MGAASNVAGLFSRGRSLRNRRGLSGLVMAARRKKRLVGRARRGRARALWHHSYASAREFWPGLCRLWRRLYCAFVTVGVKDRWRLPGYARYDRGIDRPAWGVCHHVLAALTR